MYTFMVGEKCRGREVRVLACVAEGRRFESRSGQNRNDITTLASYDRRVVIWSYLRDVIAEK